MKNALNIDFSVKAQGAKSAPTPRQQVGAIRRSNLEQPAKRKLPVQKISVCGLCVLAAGLMATTTSTGSNGTAESKLKPVKVAAITSPTFFFDDATNALGEGKQLLSASDEKVVSTAKVLNFVVL